LAVSEAAVAQEGALIAGLDPDLVVVDDPRDVALAGRRPARRGRLRRDLASARLEKARVRAVGGPGRLRSRSGWRAGVGVGVAAGEQGAPAGSRGAALVCLGGGPRRDGPRPLGPLVA